MTGGSKGLSHALFSPSENVTAGSHGAPNEHWLSGELGRHTEQSSSYSEKHSCFMREIHISCTVRLTVGGIWMNPSKTPGLSWLWVLICKMSGGYGCFQLSQSHTLKKYKDRNRSVLIFTLSSEDSEDLAHLAGVEHPIQRV